MAETPEAPDTLALLKQNHRTEQKALQAKITQKKKAASKKTRKGVNDECDKLQTELNERHAAEIAALTGGTEEKKEETIEQDLDALTIEENATEEKDAASTNGTSHSTPTSTTASSQPTQSKKPNRQKARLARRAAEAAAASENAASEALSLPDLRAAEKDSLQHLFKKYSLSETEIRPDGHCLYSAVALSLVALGKEKMPFGYKEVRSQTADFITTHKDDFAPFMEEDIGIYTHKIKDTAEWGGQLELQAISRAQNVKIMVLQSGGGDGVVEIGEGSADENERIWLAYYRHGFGLGEHYNALRKTQV